MIEKIRKIKGCWDVSEKPRYTIDDIGFKKCLGNYYMPVFSSVWSMFQMYKKGSMPFGGAMVDQPAKVVEIFNLLYNLENEYKQSQMDKERHMANQGRR